MLTFVSDLNTCVCAAGFNRR